MTDELIIRALLSGILMGAIYGVLGMGFTIVYGILDLPIFTHGVFAMWAMYLIYLLTNHVGVPLYPGFLLLFALAYLFGVVLYKTVLRFILDIEHEMQLVFFLGLLIALANLALIVFGPTSLLLNVKWLERVVFLGQVSLKAAMMVGAAVSILFIVCMELFFRKTETGKAIRACADNRKGALIVGLNVSRMYTTAIGLSLVCSAVAGLAFAPLVPIYPDLGFEYAILACLIAVLGGAGDMKGALVAGFVMGLLMSIQQMFYDLTLSRLILYAVMLGILMFRPTGILGKGKSFAK
ncbi:MAG: branched-chain amino acid transporter permease [candidate division NC10 bacterium]|nr:branched-chain amino acid transporter permease [candidate division NC10 bacterium]